jgi:hypothetical protein
MTGVHFAAGPGSFMFFVLYSVQTGFKTDPDSYPLNTIQGTLAEQNVMLRVGCGTIRVLFHLLSYHFVPVLQNYSEKSSNCRM